MFWKLSVVSHSFCKTLSLVVWSNSRGKKTAVCLAFLREGYTTHKKKQDGVYVLLKCKAALPVRVA